MPRCSPLSLLVLLAACQDSLLTATREEPIVAILQPARGSTLMEGADVRFSATVSDPDGREELVLLTWRVGDEEPCTGPASVEGESHCDVQIPTGVSQLAVVLSAIDGDRLSGQDTAHYGVAPNAAPTVRIDAPTEDQLGWVDRHLELRGVVGDVETLPGDLSVTWTSDKDGVLLGGAEAPASDGGTGGYVSLSEGDHTITLSVADEASKVSRAQVLVHIAATNAPPACAITAPDDGAPLVLGAPVTLRADVDDDGGVAHLLITWTSDLDGRLGTSLASMPGEVTLPVATLSRGRHRITLHVTDGAGASCDDVVTVGVGSRPTITITSPTEGRAYRVGEPVSATVQVADDETAATDLVLSSSVDLAAVPAPAPDASGLATVPLGSPDAGAHTLTFRVVDADGFDAVASRGFVVNHPPTTPVIALVPASPTTVDALVATFVTASTDADGQPVDYVWRWMRDGVVVPAYTTSSVPASATTKHEAWTASVTPTDHVHDGAPGEATVTVSNAAPVLSAVTITPSTDVRAGTRLDCATTATDADADTLTRRFTWLDSAAHVLSTTSTWVVAGVAPGTTITCVATVDDGDGGTATNGASIVVANTPPVVADVTISPSTGIVPRSTLTCTANVTDPDGGTPTIGRVWKTDAGDVLGVGALLALTDATAPPGTQVTCTVTASDGLGTTSGAASIVVDDPRPQITAVDVVVDGGGPPGITKTLRCVPSGFADPQGDADASRFLWTVDGVTAGSQPTLAGAFDRGQTVRCVVIPSDGTYDGAPRFDEVVIVDLVPSIAGVTLLPVRPVASSVLTCAYSGFVDGDGDADASTYAWKIDGVGVAATTSTLSGGLVAGDVVTCTVTPRSAGPTAGTPKSASVVVDAPPGAPTVTITPSVAGTWNDLVCSMLPASDPEGDPLTYEIRWRVDGAGTAYATSGVSDTATLVVPSSATDGGETWTCEARAFDGAAYGPWGSASVELGCPVVSGQGAGCAGTTCATILLDGGSYGDGPYWVDPTASGTPFQAWCDMTSDGGGWTLVLQAKSLSTYVYDHAVWSNPSTANPILWDVSADVDAVSPAFYEQSGTQTRLCVARYTDDTWACEQIHHASATPTALATGPVLTTSVSTRGLLTDTLLSVVPDPDDWGSFAWQRWGWNHGTDVCGGLRVGFSSDGDNTDSRDAAIGVGFHLYDSGINCNPKEYALLGSASGYHHFPWAGVGHNHPTPTAAPLPAKVWFR